MPRGFVEDQTLSTIKAILENGKDDEQVRVKGKLTKYLGDENFEFQDNENNTIVVELDSDRNWSYLEKDMPIEIVAKIDEKKSGKILEVQCARPENMEALKNFGGNGPCINRE